MLPPAPEDCTTCGACCFSESARHVRVSGDDHARLGDDAEDWVTWLGNEAYLRLAPILPGNADRETVHACAALRVEAASGRFLCAIYMRRPTICRELGRGSPGCDGERDAKGSRPTRVLAVLGPRLSPRPGTGTAR